VAKAPKALLIPLSRTRVSAPENRSDSRKEFSQAKWLC
jgi:hypothetical protein